MYPHDGYANLEDDPFRPCSIITCDTSPCGYGKCKTQDTGSFSCECPKGFKQGEGNEQCRECELGFRPGNQLESCQDINECEVNVCTFGTCINTIGSFYCSCADEQDKCNYPEIEFHNSTRGCSTNYIDETTVVYKAVFSENLDNAVYCKAKFSCLNDQILNYSIQRFHFPSNECLDNYLGLYIIYNH